MKIRQEFVNKHWLLAAMEEVEEKYRNEGYIVEREKEIEGCKAGAGNIAVFAVPAGRQHRAVRGSVSFPEERSGLRSGSRDHKIR